MTLRKGIDIGVAIISVACLLPSPYLYVREDRYAHIGPTVFVLLFTLGMIGALVMMVQGNRLVRLILGVFGMAAFVLFVAKAALHRIVDPLSPGHLWSAIFTLAQAAYFLATLPPAPKSGSGYAQPPPC